MLTLMLLTALAAGLRLSRLGAQSFWFDEGNTVQLVHLSYSKMLGLLPQSESTPPLYYCLAWLWARLFGFGEAGLRSLSAVAGVACVPLAYLAGDRLISRPAGVVAAALTACNPLLIWYSQEARAYALLVLWSIAALAALGVLRAGGGLRAMGAWATCSALAVGTHYYALLAVAPQALWLLVRFRHRRSAWAATAAVAAVAIALLPLALSQSSAIKTGWISRIPLGLRLGQTGPQFLVGFQSAERGAVTAVAAVAGAAGVLLLIRADGTQRRGALLAGALALSGLLSALLLVAGGRDELLSRNLIPLWPATMLLLAGGLGSRRLGIGAAAGLCAAGLFVTGSVARNRDYQRPDWRVVAQLVGQPRPGVRRVILTQRYGYGLPLSLYLPGLKLWRDQVSVPARELDVVAVAGAPGAYCWWGSACNLSPSPAQRVYAIPGMHELWRRHRQQFTVVRLVSAQPVRLTRAIIRRALTATRLGHRELKLQP